jgi:hypothetical protein
LFDFDAAIFNFDAAAFTFDAPWMDFDAAMFAFDAAMPYFDAAMFTMDSGLFNFDAAAMKFSCGNDQCAAFSQMCQVGSGGGNASPYQCAPLPSACVNSPTCNCVKGALGVDQCSGNPGSLTLTMPTLPPLPSSSAMPPMPTPSALPPMPAPSALPPIAPAR